MYACASGLGGFMNLWFRTFRKKGLGFKNDQGFMREEKRIDLGLQTSKKKQKLNLPTICLNTKPSMN